MADWAILRTAGASTIRLAQTLTAAGIEAWTPTEARMKRLPRSKAQREITAPILPTFVFARADRIVELRALAKATKKAQPDFSVFVYRGGERAVSDEDLEPLRQAERDAAHQARKRKQADPIPVGTEVRVETGVGAGLEGVVGRSSKKETIVLFPTSAIPLTIATSILQPVAVQRRSLNKSKAARAA